MAVRLCEELAAQLRREILVQQGDKRTRELRAEKAADEQLTREHWEEEAHRTT